MVRHSEGPEAGDGDAVAADEARSYPLYEGIQRAGGLRPGQGRVQCDFVDEVSLVHDAASSIKRGYRCQSSGAKSWVEEIAQFAILPYREETMDANTTVKLIAGILAVVLVAIIVMRRKKKGASSEDEF
jgi:hypothetical protein